MTKLSCIVPCYRRPKRTIRLLNNFLLQDFKRAEIIMVGDGCDDFAENMKNGVFKAFQSEIRSMGNEITFINLREHMGGYGSAARGQGIQLAKGQFTIFVDNDDTVAPEHFSNYYQLSVDNPNLDLGIYDTFVEPYNRPRNAEATFGQIGHSEIMVRTELLKRLYRVDPEYGHDWTLIKRILNSGAVVIKSRAKPTYTVKGVPENREKIND